MATGTTINTAEAAGPHGLLSFIEELRRRRVCRAITLYAVALWLICQVIDVIEGPIGLPQWTLSLVLVLGLLGLPIALILSWLFDITPQGLVPDGTAAGARTHTEPRRPFDQAIDCALLGAALLIGLQLGYGALTRDSVAALPDVLRVSVAPFQSSSGVADGGMAAGLVVELQHALLNGTDVAVVDSMEAAPTAGSRSIAGVVAIDEEHIRVTATLIDSATREVVWSQAFERPNTGLAGTTAVLANDIVQALPIPRAVPVASAANDHNAK